MGPTERRRVFGTGTETQHVCITSTPYGRRIVRALVPYIWVEQERTCTECGKLYALTQTEQEATKL